ncbi:MAG: hypothetical protein ACP5VR_05900 [Acidimicrobiales bacterium]
MTTTRYQATPLNSARPSGREDGEAVRNVSLTGRCGVCNGPLPAGRRRRWCSDRCRQAAFRARQAAPRLPQPARCDIVYECPVCEARYLGQRCEECNTFCRRLGPGGPCPHCDELVVLSDFLGPEQLAPAPSQGRSRRGQTKERP